MRYSRFTAALPTRAFLAPLAEDEEVEVELAPGNVVSIAFKGGRGKRDWLGLWSESRATQVSTHPARPAPHPAVSPLRADGTRDVFFEANGVPRVVDVVDEKAAAGGAGAPARRAARDRADPRALGSVGAPMSGDVVAVKCKPGTRVAAGEALVVLSAMKMETAVAAPTVGVFFFFLNWGVGSFWGWGQGSGLGRRQPQPAHQAGVVAHVPVDVGDAVDAGDLICVIRDDLPDILDDASASMDGAALAAAGAT